MIKCKYITDMPIIHSLIYPSFHLVIHSEIYTSGLVSDKNYARPRRYKFE